MLKKMPKAGDKVRYVKDKMVDMTVGKVYEIEGNDPDGYVAVFRDDCGDLRLMINTRLRYFELVEESPPAPRHFSIHSVTAHSDGSFEIDVVTDAAGYEEIKRIEADSKRQQDRRRIERQIADLQRKLDAL